MFSDEFGQAYSKFGVDRARGAIAVVRPDGYVGVVCGCEDGYEEVVRRYLNGAVRAVCGCV